ncbi:MAG: UbiA family prenyltransferase [Candidatus Omnitrophica bacterium]|nr:UbiA family prenyltransferase [Candidatus Omnitrophota bacterium]
MRRLKDFVARCEGINIGLGLWICTFLAIVFIRDCIEGLVVSNFFPEFNEFHLLHFPVFFVSALLALIILLHFFTKTDIIKVSKICLIFFAVIILPAALDFLLSLSVGREVDYEYITEDIWKALVNFFNPFVTLPAIPFTIRIEIAAITFCSFLYIFIKRNKILWSLLGAFLAFIICFFYIAVPGILVGSCVVFLKVLSSILRFAHLPLGGAGLGGIVDEKVVVIQELIFTAILGAIWFWRYDLKKAKALFANLRLNRSFHYMLLVLMGFVLYLSEVRGVLDLFILLKMAGILLAVFFAFQFSVVVNDIFDIDCDKASNSQRPLVTGTLGKSEYLKVGYVYLALALLFAFWVSGTCFMITLVYIAFYFVYSAPPLRLKRFFPVSSLVIGIQALLAFLLGQMSLQGESEGFFAYSNVWIMIFTVFLLSSNIKDLKDIEGDRNCNIRTLPVIFGETKARMTIGFLVFLSYLLVPIFLYPLFYSPLVTYSALLFGLANYFYIKKPGTQEKPVFFMYFSYALLIVLFLRKTQL